jgi:predicted PurR-regulated permease PerM
MKQLKIINNKKGLSMTWEVLVTIIILLVVAVIIIFTFATKFGDGTSDLPSTEQGSDKDNDGVPDFMDPCKGENPEFIDQRNEDNCPGIGNW